MLINKIGYEHIESWNNCQDFGFNNENIKCIVDGCSEGQHSEVGAKLFCHLFAKNNDMKMTFDVLTTIFTTPEDIKNYLLFTIIYLVETDEFFEVNICGDGVVIKQNYDDSIDYEVIDYNNTPPYYAYNYFPKEKLSLYKDGVEFVTKRFLKSDYKSIGIATDGISYIINSENKQVFEEYLVKRKASGIKRLINQSHKAKDLIQVLQTYTIDELRNLKAEYNRVNKINKQDCYRDDVTIII